MRCSFYNTLVPVIKLGQRIYGNFSWAPPYVLARKLSKASTNQVSLHLNGHRHSESCTWAGTTWKLISLPGISGELPKNELSGLKRNHLSHTITRLREMQKFPQQKHRLFISNLMQLTRSEGKKKRHSVCFGLTSRRSVARQRVRASAEGEPAGSPGSAAYGSAPRSASSGSRSSTVPSRGMGPED